MVIFQDIQDVEEWLEPLDYIAFWEAVGPYGLTLQDREMCDGLIASGKAEPGLILQGLKFLAQRELARKFGLKRRSYEPPSEKYLTSVH